MYKARFICIFLESPRPLTLSFPVPKVTVLTVLTGAVLVPFQLSRLEQVRLITEGTSNGSDDEAQDDVLGLDVLPLTGTITTTLTDTTIKVSSPFFVAANITLTSTSDVENQIWACQANLPLRT